MASLQQLSTDPTLQTLKTLRWIQRAEGLLAELDRDSASDPDVAAVRDALATQLRIERDRLRQCRGAPLRASVQQ